MHKSKKITPIIVLLWAVGIGIHGINILTTVTANAWARVGIREQDELAPDCVINPRNPREIRCSYYNGDTYVGEAFGSVAFGKGIYIFANDDYYEGEFRNGLPNGRGVLIQGDDRYEGEFRDSKIFRGTAYFSSGDRYVGQFLNNLPNDPQGQFTFANGDRFRGEFISGRPFGQGELIRADGSRCQGRFFGSNLNSSSANCTFSNGARYQGELREGLPHGAGLLIEANGKRYQGQFRDGLPFVPR